MHFFSLFSCNQALFLSITFDLKVRPLPHHSGHSALSPDNGHNHIISSLNPITLTGHAKRMQVSPRWRLDRVEMESGSLLRNPAPVFSEHAIPLSRLHTYASIDIFNLQLKVLFPHSTLFLVTFDHSGRRFLSFETLGFLVKRKTYYINVLLCTCAFTICVMISTFLKNPENTYSFSDLSMLL